MPHPAIDLLLARRSVSANALGEPGPAPAEVELMLKAASRVPDHKKLVPWRFLLFQGEARAEFGKVRLTPGIATGALLNGRQSCFSTLAPSGEIV